MKFSIVLPCYNEQENILNTLGDITEWTSGKDFETEIIAVNDGSVDATADMLQKASQKDARIRVLNHPHNRGYGAALVTGLDAAAGDVIGFMDSDGQFKAEDFDLLLPHIDAYPCVIGRRQKRADPVMRSVNALCYGLLVKVVLMVRVRDINCGMKIFRREIWPVIRPEFATGALFNAELLYRMTRARLGWRQINVQHYPRRFGTPTGANPAVILKMFVDLFKLRLRSDSGRKAKTP